MPKDCCGTCEFGAMFTEMGRESMNADLWCMQYEKARDADQYCVYWAKKPERVVVKHVDFRLEFLSWAKWLAVDSDGTICIYRYRPKFQGTAWNTGGSRQYDISAGRCKVVGRITCFPEGWDPAGTLRELSKYE